MPDANTDADVTPHAVAMSLCGMLAYLGSGQTSDLRRLDDDAAVPAYWRLAARHDVLARQPNRWVPIVRALALLTPKGQPGERPDLHDGKRKLGTALCDGGVAEWPGPVAPGQNPRPALSERRLAQLLAARGTQRSVLLTRAVRALAANRDPRVGLDVGDLAWAFLRGDNASALARPYYHRLDRAQYAADDTERRASDA